MNLLDMMRKASQTGIDYPTVRGEHSLKLVYMSHKDYIAIKIDGTYIGKINSNNELILYDFHNLKDYILNLMDDPYTLIKVYGHKHGNCCFCGRRLDNAVSVQLGYGPICAEKFGLPHEPIQIEPKL